MNRDADEEVFAGTPVGRVIHSGAVDEQTGEFRTDCSRTLPEGWQEFETTIYAVSCKQCIARDKGA